MKLNPWMFNCSMDWSIDQLLACLFDWFHACCLRAISTSLATAWHIHLQAHSHNRNHLSQTGSFEALTFDAMPKVLEPEAFYEKARDEAVGASCIQAVSCGMLCYIWLHVNSKQTDLCKLRSQSWWQNYHWNIYVSGSKPGNWWPSCHRNASKPGVGSLASCLMFCLAHYSKTTLPGLC